ncbi:MAG: DUF1549 domain-containing protein, partial [Limisphaerales bacterium]
MLAELFGPVCGNHGKDLGDLSPVACAPSIPDVSRGPALAPHGKSLLRWLGCLLILGLIGGLWIPGSRAAEKGESTAAEGEGVQNLTVDALRILRARCFGCHNPEKNKGGLVLTSRDTILTGGDSGKAALPGNPSTSRMIEVLAAEAEPHMPPKEVLLPREVRVLEQWVEAGLPWDESFLSRLNATRTVELEDLPNGYRPIHAVALDPTSRRVAWGLGGEVLIGDLAETNESPSLRIKAHAGVVNSVAWSPDGRFLATGGFREVTLRNSSDLKVAWSVRSNLRGRILALEFTPHGGALIVGEGSAAESGWVHALEFESGRTLASWLAHGDTIMDVAISPDGGVLATAGSDKLVKTWELLTQREVGRFEGHSGAVLGVAFNPAGSELISVGADRQLKLWDARTREAVVTMGGRGHSLNAVSWSADGSRVAAVDEEGRLFGFTDFKRHTGEQSSATAKEKALGNWRETLHAVAISGDGKTLVAGGEDGVLHVVNSEGKDPRTLVGTPDDRSPEASPEGAVGVASADRVARVGGGSGASGSPGEAESEPGPKTTPDSPPSFVRDVLPVLAKAGCSAGSCHAKPEGQQGFKLSVFSYDPAADYMEIVKEARGRRVFPAAPEESLLLLKPTGTLEHGGGRRIDPGSNAYAMLLRWLRAGMPYQGRGEPMLEGIAVYPGDGTYRKDSVQTLTVEARYSDGTTRDVTQLAEYSASEREIADVDDKGSVRVGRVSGETVIVARYMGFVDASRITVPSDKALPGERYAALPAHNFIDELAYAQFRRLGIFPSELCTDEEFIRRAYLDTLGVLPTADEVRTFLKPTVPGALEASTPGGSPSGSGVNAAVPRERPGVRARRSDLIENLLDRPEFVDFWANKWADLLRPNPDRVGVKSVFTIDQWLRDWFRSGRPYDEFARAILLAEGTNHRDGPVVVYRDRREPPELTTMFSQLFLGVRMECAKCHHHPNEKWSQDDFYQFA